MAKEKEEITFEEKIKLLEEIVKSKDKELDFEMKIFEKTSDIDFDDEGSEENDEK